MQDAKRRALIFLTLALFLATAAGYLFLQKVSAVDASLGERKTIFVATKNISSREPLKPEYFQAKEIPEQFVLDSEVTDLNAINIDNSSYPINSLSSVVPLKEGELLTKNVLKSQYDLTSKDMRMVNIARSDRVGFDGTFDLNDRVDIIVTDKDGNNPSKTFLFMKDVLVVGVAKDQNGTVTGLGLEMTLDDAQKFIYEQNFAVNIRLLKAPSLKDTGSKKNKTDTKTVDIQVPVIKQNGKQGKGSSQVPGG